VNRSHTFSTTFSHLPGERGRKLAKRLVGSQSLIYETYLEQKSGHRILWVPGDDNSILIWYVASHDNVPHYMKLIDDSENRGSRQLTGACLLLGEENNENSTTIVTQQKVHLDPRSNSPLKLFEVALNEIEHVVTDENWRPQLYLTDEERCIVQTKGSVLVLGRSGTGKTVCIANRMDYDRQCHDSNTLFSQLFVARSQRLCTFVRASVDAATTTNNAFLTFDQLLRSLERTLPAVEGTRCQFLLSQKIDFQRFKREVHSSSDGIDALIAWSSIRSFIKGSIEAQQWSDKILSESTYLDLGKRRCRLSIEQRQSVYKIFQRYSNYTQENGLWDEMDRASSIVKRLEHARQSVSPEFETVRRSKVYVDEVQDYTQAEIYVFFLLSGPGDLFLAGDPCQLVVEGVDFRFEDIRSVGFFVCGNERNDPIPDKPQTVNTNFRSHSGVLETAAALLRILFHAFPNSAKQLKGDRGLFAGPRPGVFPRVSFEQVQEAATTHGGGIVVLVHGSAVPRCKNELGGYPLVYGIREAKGLEFQHVVILDFFNELSPSLQKPWRELLLGRAVDTDFATQYPEVEGHLKLLYTAVTRSMNRLFFVETKASSAGDAFLRWITTCSTKDGSDRQRTRELATRCRLDDVEQMRQTPDDWRSNGFDNIIMAETGDDLEASDSWVERALYCIQQADDSEFRHQSTGVSSQSSISIFVGTSKRCN